MSVERYSRAAMALHWVIAGLLAFQLGLGWRMKSMATPAGMYAPFQFHKSIGFVILALSLLRLSVRMLHRRPPAHGSGWQGGLASTVHALFYGLMIGAPLSGWMVVSTAKLGIPTRLFGAVPLPHLPLGQVWHDPAESAHGALAWIGCGLILLHVAGALRHHVGAGGVSLIGRMAPVGEDKLRGLFIGVIAAAGLGLAFVAPWLIYRDSPQPFVSAPARAGRSDGPSSDAPSEAASDEEATSTDALPAPEVSAPTIPTWRVLPGGTLGFKVMVSGSAVEGRFANWTAKIALDPSQPEGGRIEVRIPVLTAATGDGTRDAMLKGEDFFGNSTPVAIYRSTAVTRLAGTDYKAVGTLSLNGSTKPVSLRFSLAAKGDLATVSGKAELDRLAFRVGKGQWAATDQIAGKVDIDFAFKAKRSQKQ